MGVVKADAYGHGAIPVARRLQAESIDALGVARIEEGIELRDGGISTPIYILSGVYEDRAEELVEHDLIPVLFDLDVARALHDTLSRRGLDLPFHLKVDTGMNRIGIRPENVAAAVEELRGLPHLELTGILTHFAESEAADPTFTAGQLRKFREVLDDLRLENVVLHASNSGAVTEHSEAHLDFVRPGIMLYGALPDPRLAESIQVDPVMQLATRVIHCKQVPAETPISYGRTFVTEKPTQVATLAVGYGDGYSRALSNRGEVLIHGQRAPILGAVCMDLTMVDVTGIPDVAAGDEAVLLGDQGSDRIPADELASLMGTIPYEVFTSVSKRVPRVYTQGSDRS